jgi:hypothetical protein
MLSFLVVMSEAFAQECARIRLDEVTLARDGATAVLVRESGSLERGAGKGRIELSSFSGDVEVERR